MKKLILGGFAIVLFMVIGYIVYVFYFQERVSPPDTAQFSQDGVELTIDYSRPSKKGRLIFGSDEDDALQPYGEYWRLGANEATKLTTNQSIDIMGNMLGPGSYAMYAFPDKEVWTIGFNSESENWGAWEPDYDHDVFRIEVKPTDPGSIIEQMIIRIEESDSYLAEIYIGWDNIELRIPVNKN